MNEAIPGTEDDKQATYIARAVLTEAADTLYKGPVELLLKSAVLHGIWWERAKYLKEPPISNTTPPDTF